MSEIKQEVPELPGFKVFGILRFTAALLSSPCPLCNGKNYLDEYDYCIAIGHHQVPCCRECLPKVGQITTAALAGVVSQVSVASARHEVTGITFEPSVPLSDKQS